MGDGTEPNVQLRNYAIDARNALRRGDVEEAEILPKILEEIKRMDEEEQQWGRCARCGEPSISTFCTSCEGKAREEMKNERS